MEIALMNERELLYAELLHFAKHRGYAHGWVGVRYKEGTGLEPDGVEAVEPIPPSEETLHWLRVCAIAGSKKRPGPLHPAFRSADSK
jgi:hypothetical protein